MKADWRFFRALLESRVRLARALPALLPGFSGRSAASPAAEGRGGVDRTLILVFNTMWGVRLPLEQIVLPEGCEVTYDRGRFAEARAVVFHLPTLHATTLRRLGKPPGQLWVAWSLECDAHYPQQRSRRFLRWFDLRMTYHRGGGDLCTLLELLRRQVSRPPEDSTASEARRQDCRFRLFE